MSTAGVGWYYMQKHWTGEKSVGPVSDMMLYEMAYNGKLNAKSAVMHPKHTQGTWVFLEQVPLAKANIDRRAEELKEAEELAIKEKSEARVEKWRAEQRRKAENAAQPPSPSTPIPVAQPAAVPLAAQSQPQFIQPMRPQFRCPFCQSTAPPYSTSQTSNGGWIFFWVLFFFLCWPICWIGLLIKEHSKYCTTCGMKLS